MIRQISSRQRNFFNELLLKLVGTLLRLMGRREEGGRREGGREGGRKGRREGGRERDREKERERESMSFNCK